MRKGGMQVVWAQSLSVGRMLRVCQGAPLLPPACRHIPSTWHRHAPHAELRGGAPHARARARAPGRCARGGGRAAAPAGQPPDRPAPGLQPVPARAAARMGGLAARRAAARVWRRWRRRRWRDQGRTRRLGQPAGGPGAPVPLGGALLAPHGGGAAWATRAERQGEAHSARAVAPLWDVLKLAHTVGNTVGKTSLVWCLGAARSWRHQKRLQARGGAPRRAKAMRRRLHEPAC